MDENTPTIEDTTTEVPVETPVEVPVKPIVEIPIEEPVIDTHTELPIDPIEVVTLRDEETLSGKTFTFIKDNLTSAIVGVAIGYSGSFAIAPDNTLKDNLTVKDIPNIPKEELVIRKEKLKVDVEEYTIKEKNKNIARLQEKLDRLESARQSYIANQEEDWEKRVVYGDGLIKGVRDSIAAENRDKDEAQPKLDELPDRVIENNDIEQ